MSINFRLNTKHQHDCSTSARCAVSSRLNDSMYMYSTVISHLKLERDNIEFSSWHSLLIKNTAKQKRKRNNLVAETLRTALHRELGIHQLYFRINLTQFTTRLEQRSRHTADMVEGSTMLVGYKRIRFLKPPTLSRTKFSK